MSKPLGTKCCAMLVMLSLAWPVALWSQFFNQSIVGDVSKSGRSVTINRGLVEGLRIGQRARFYSDEGMLDFVGEAELIKANDNNSFWYFRQLPTDAKLRSGQKVHFALTEAALTGARELKVLQTKSVKANDRASTAAQAHLPKEFIVKGDDYVAGEEVVETDPTFDFDAALVSETEWTQGNIPITSEDYDEEMRAIRPQEELTLESSDEFREIENAATAKGISDNSVKKVAKARAAGAKVAVPVHPEMPNSIPSEFDLYKDQLVSQDKLASETRAKIKKNGELWSSGLTDQELRRTIIESGVIEERERRRRLASNLPSHHISFRYATGLSPQTTEADANNNGNNYGIGFGYEYMLEHASESLASWSIEGVLERGINFQDLGGDGINGRIAWGALGLHVNWFMFSRPSAIRKIIPYVGGAIKRGNGDLESGLLSQSYDVQMLGTQLHAGLRYRFSGGDEFGAGAQIGMGIFALMTFENSRFNTTTGLADNIESVYSITEQRLIFGLSAFF